MQFAEQRMERYRDLSGTSGVTGYEIGAHSITVQFRSGDVYLYTAEMPGRREVQRMQQLARDGVGLSTYISRHVRERYAQKLS